MNDLLLVGVLVLFAVVVTSIFWISYGAYKADQMRANHAEHIAKLHEGYAIQREVYGSVPIERLVGYENSATESEYEPK